MGFLPFSLPPHRSGMKNSEHMSLFKFSCSHCLANCDEAENIKRCLAEKLPHDTFFDPKGLDRQTIHALNYVVTYIAKVSFNLCTTFKDLLYQYILYTLERSLLNLC